MTLHSRNRHSGRYDFPALIRTYPELAPFVAENAHGDESIDFANPEAIKALNRALLKSYYGVTNWDIPKGYLCPPIPGRADYIHHAAELIDGARGARVLDIGVGANCIYPIIGYHEYGWKFVGSDTDPVAVASAQLIVKSNPGLAGAIEIRQQKSPPQIFKGMIGRDEKFDLVISNPPFHSSAEAARAGSSRKWKNLGKGGQSARPVLNFGGQNSELWCEGGELAFIRRMIEESAQFRTQVRWFTTLVSNSDNLPAIASAIGKIGADETRTIDMAQGQKKSRIVAWAF